MLWTSLISRFRGVLVSFVPLFLFKPVLTKAIQCVFQGAEMLCVVKP